MGLYCAKAKPKTWLTLDQVYFFKINLLYFLKYILIASKQRVVETK